MVKIGIEIANDITLNEMKQLMNKLDKTIQNNKSLIKDVKVVGGTSYLTKEWKKQENKRSW